jgi:hypothetical protein
MSKQKKAMGWDEAIQGAGELPKGHLEKCFSERAAEAERWAKELKDAPAGRPVVRMGRPRAVEPKLVDLGPARVAWSRPCRTPPTVRYSLHGIPSNSS